MGLKKTLKCILILYKQHLLPLNFMPKEKFIVVERGGMTESYLFCIAKDDKNRF